MRIFTPLIFLFLLLTLSVQAQVEPFLTIEPVSSAERLVREKLLNRKSGIYLSNVKYSGAMDAIGYFKFHMLYNALLPKGILLSTGRAADAIGPNTEPGSTTRYQDHYDAELQSLSKEKVMDAAVLEFDLIPDRDSLSFRYFFASEEYPEYVNKKVNDVFAFFLTDVLSGEKINLALLQPGNLPIAVDNINSRKNSQYYIENGSWDAENAEKWREDLQRGELAYALQYDGLTTVLQAGARVQAGRVYHLKMAIADAGDGLFDSAIFLEGESLRSLPHAVPQPPAYLVRMKGLIVKQFDSSFVTMKDSAVTLSLKVNFASNRYQLDELASLELLQKIAAILEEDPKLLLQVEGHTDNAGTPAFNQTLSLNRARTVADYLVSIGVARERLSTVGYGNTQPLGKGNLAANRRVVFVFTTR